MPCSTCVLVRPMRDSRVPFSARFRGGWSVVSALSRASLGLALLSWPGVCWSQVNDSSDVTGAGEHAETPPSDSQEAPPGQVAETRPPGSVEAPSSKDTETPPSPSNDARAGEASPRELAPGELVPGETASAGSGARASGGTALQSGATSATGDAAPSPGGGEASATSAEAAARPEENEVAIRVDEVELEFKARAMTGWEYENERPRGGQPGEDSSSFGFFLQQARVGVDARIRKFFRMQVELELTDAATRLGGVRDVWVNMRFSKRLQLRVGHAKRPFSRLEDLGVSDLPIRGRGLGNDLIVEDLGYGDRALLGELRGRVDALGLKWAVSASNPPPNQPGVDLHGRVEVDATKWLEFGAGLAHKIADDPGTLQDDFIAGQAYNVDMRAKGGGVYVVVDAIAGEDLRFPERPLAGSLAGYASYDIGLNDDWTLQPVVFGEWADSNLEFRESEAVRTIIGVNALWNDEHLRIMPQIELVRPLDVSANTIWVASDAAYVFLAGQI